MYEELEPIANLKIGKEVDAIAREKQGEQAATMAQLAAQGTVQSGNAVAAVMRIQLKGAERLCRFIADTWIDLIQRKNKRIAREDIAFVMQKVQTCAAVRASSISAGITSMPALRGIVTHTYLSAEATQEMQRVASNIHRDLEINFREREVFPHEAKQSDDPRFQLSIQNSNISNLNLGSQLGAISTALQVMSSGSQEQQSLAEALKELTEAVIASDKLQPPEKKEIVQAFSTLAEQAEVNPEDRSTGTIRAIANWLPTALATAADAITVWDRLLPTIRRYFGL